MCKHLYSRGFKRGSTCSSMPRDSNADYCYKHKNSKRYHPCSHEGCDKIITSILCAKHDSSRVRKKLKVDVCMQTYPDDVSKKHQYVDREPVNNDVVTIDFAMQTDDGSFLRCQHLEEELRLNNDNVSALSMEVDILNTEIATHIAARQQQAVNETKLLQRDEKLNKLMKSNGETIKNLKEKINKIDTKAQEIYEKDVQIFTIQAQGIDNIGKHVKNTTNSALKKLYEAVVNNVRTIQMLMIARNKLIDEYECELQGNSRV